MGHFIVTTRGRTGSFWLANAFDMHPEIICSHGRVRAPASWLFADRINMYYSRVYSKGMKWTNKELPDQLATMLSRYCEHEIQRGRSKEYPDNIDDLLKEQEEIGQADYYGKVHGFQLRDIIRMYKQKPPAKEIKIANQIRNPVKIVNSGLKDFSKKFEKEPNLKRACHNKYKKIITRYNLLPTTSELAFIKMVDDIDSYLETLEHEKLLQIPLEKVTKNKDFLCFVLRTLTSFDLKISDEYLDNVFNHGRLNNHVKNPKKQSPEEIFSSWQFWQKDHFRRKLMQYEEYFPKMYELGYDIEKFLKTSNAKADRNHNIYTYTENKKNNDREIVTV